MSIKKFYLIRHGETDWNKEKRMQGHTDIPLNPLGNQQANSLLPLFNDIQINTVVSSDLMRTMETANALIEKFGLKLHLDHRLRESHLGELEGMTVQEVHTKYGENIIDVWRSLHPETMDFSFPGGESKQTVLNRTKSALKEWATKLPDEKIAVCTHGGVMRLLLTSVLNEKPREVVVIENCAVYELTYDLNKQTWSTPFRNLNLSISGSQ